MLPRVRNRKRSNIFYCFSDTAGATLVNQVKRAAYDPGTHAETPGYNGFGQLLAEYQDHAAAVTYASHALQYAYTETATGTVNNSRITHITYPNGRLVYYNYNDAGDTAGVSNAISRITAICSASTRGTSDANVIASYDSLGLSMAIRKNYPTPAIRLDRYGGTSGTYAGLDHFNRITSQEWTAYDPTTSPYDNLADIPSYNLAYSSTETTANEATFSTGSILWIRAAYDGATLSLKEQVNATQPSDASWSSVPTCFTLSGFTYTSGMLGFQPNSVSGSGISNLVVKSWNTSTSAFDVTELEENFATNGSGYAGDDSNSDYSLQPLYDNNGNLLFDGTEVFTYDAWNRLKTVAHGYRTGSSASDVHSGQVFQTTSYDATGRRIIKAITGTGNLDCTYHYYLNNQSVIEERNGSDESIKDHVWGLDYIDEAIQTRINTDPTGTPAWSSYYLLQDANFNVLGIVDSSGILVERYEYTAYGQRQVFYSPGSNDPGCYAPTPISTRVVTTGSITQPYGLNDFGHQGLMCDEQSGLVYNRARMLNPTLGRSMQCDPLGYVDGPNQYQYLRSRPNNDLDPTGNQDLTLQVGLAGNGVAIDVNGTNDLRDLMNGIKAKIKCGDCIKKITFVGEGTDPGDPERINQPVPDPPKLLPPDPKDPLKNNQRLGSDDGTGKLTPETVAFAKELKALACPSGFWVIFWSCNMGNGPIGKKTLQNIADLVGGDVTGYQNYVSAYGLGFSIHGFPNPITVNPKK